jgi:hypothetical protein
LVPQHATTLPANARVGGLGASSMKVRRDFDMQEFALEIEEPAVGSPTPGRVPLS